MPWTGNKGPSEKQKCAAGCGRYWQSIKTHLCRQCEKETGIIDSLNTQIRKELLAAAEAADKMQTIARPKLARELVVNGQSFDVVWDGSK